MTRSRCPSTPLLTAAFILLALAMLIGSLLAVLDMRSGRATRLWGLAALHGAAALGGFACLLPALRGPARGLDQGTPSFGMISAGLLAAAVLMGLGLLAARLRKRKLSGLQIGVHATLAVSGFVVLMAYYLA
jgi:tetrahydromethanopterin S-methyltransferase subunit C